MYNYSFGKGVSKKKSTFKDLPSPDEVPSESSFGHYLFGRRRRYRRKGVRKGRKSKKPSKALVKLCRKYGIKVTRKVGGRKVYKKTGVLKKQCAKKMRSLLKNHPDRRKVKNTTRRRRSRFGEDRVKQLDEDKLKELELEERFYKELKQLEEKLETGLTRIDDLMSGTLNQARLEQTKRLLKDMINTLDTLKQVNPSRYLDLYNKCLALLSNINKAEAISAMGPGTLTSADVSTFKLAAKGIYDLKGAYKRHKALHGKHTKEARTTLPDRYTIRRMVAKEKFLKMK